MIDWLIKRGEHYWCFKPLVWSADKAMARRYARKQSAHNARLMILRNHPDIEPDQLVVVEDV